MDSFKGCMTSREANDAVREALSEADGHPEILSYPVSDGGDGMLDAFMEALGGRKISIDVHDPMMRHVTASYGILPDGTAIIESAKACGLSLVEPEKRNPLAASSYGVGELIADAVRQGSRNFVVGFGGSGTSDAGIGMLRALTDVFAPGKTIDEVLSGRLKDCRFTLACDVANPLCGNSGAARIFAPQKGAGPEEVEIIERRTAKFADMSARHFGFDRSSLPGAGAAGGLGYAFMQFMNAESRSGADLLLDMIKFDEMVANADVVITGEGSADRQTLMGKLPLRILRKAASLHVPVWLVAGRVGERDALLSSGFSKVIAVTPDGMPMEEATDKETARKNIMNAIKKECFS